ncbi:hypothetical protein ABTQ74_002844 [Salmonella enterica subsp. enterica serovar Banana]|uniref:Uncharacterized protein n=1 Tax=Salmonella enterica subsp. enterica serovar Abeokuta TaxID=2926665 RepID=A0A8T9IE31_SALET|nr:hypothetical protein [Salmonella enterica]SQJ25049.1 Uncharacterised protein [Salmonella enterica subsp. enterica] [Salmonella enterica subsp. enterica serovar Menston]ECE1929301.1 hypothetical protein [Salmonella enterica]EDW9823543.1 hypothetical protein [Salmonella enterica]EKC9955234.1 hypothetical protein [Salmonella enterica]UNO32309.1 hypothetical protein MOV10_14295 [Salmonella enterica subsp. enterica serovar Abeokuta]
MIEKPTINFSYFSHGLLMPHKQPLIDFLTRNIEPIVMILIVILARVGSVFYNSGNRILALIGDLIICCLVVTLLEPVMPDSLHGVVINGRLIAALIGVTGVHGIRLVIAYAIKHKTGIDITQGGKNV